LRGRSRYHVIAPQRTMCVSAWKSPHPRLVQPTTTNIMTRNHALLTLILVYGAASLAHFTHNAVYLNLYPNMPTWLTPLGVLTAWLGVAAIGAVGYYLFRKGLTVTGLAVITVYAALGFAGLDHYVIAPISAHSLMMNATIAAEVVAALMLLVVIVWTAFQGSPQRIAGP
jgi:hypothetical protein